MNNTDENKIKFAKVLFIIAVIYFVAPDLIPGHIDDIAFLVAAWYNKNKKVKAIEG